MQNCRYHGFSASAVSGSCTISSTRERICSIFRKSASSTRSAIAAGSSSASPALRVAAITARLRMMSVQPSLTRSSSCWPPVTSTLKFVILRCCQPGERDFAHSGSVGLLPRTSMDDGVRWKT